MREIKFRGKRIDAGEWGYGDLIFSNDYPHIGTDKENRFLRECRVDPETVGQYTGLKDKDGKEIYEGDIVQYHPEANMGTGPVVYELGAFRVQGDFDALLYHFSLKALEVIGNIHDNPELLKKEV